MPDPDNTPSSPFGRGWIPARRAIGLPGEGGWPADAPGAGPAGDPQAAAAPAEPRHDAFTPQRQARFLAALSTGGSVRGAALAVGISPQAAYVCRRRSARFAAGWDAALVLARDHAEAVLAERALDGVEEAVFYHGEEVARRRRYDSRLLLAHIARLDRRADGDAAARRRAGRFDELLALLAGAAPEGLAQTPQWARPGQPEPDPFLPTRRADHLAAATEGLGPRAYPRAHRRAEAAWNHWQATAQSLVDDLAEPGRAGAAPTPATEFKSLHPPAGISRHNPVNFVNHPRKIPARPRGKTGEPGGCPGWGYRPGGTNQNRVTTSPASATPRENTVPACAPNCGSARGARLKVAALARSADGAGSGSARAAPGVASAIARAVPASALADSAAAAKARIRPAPGTMGGRVSEA